jgi:spoIIIJ-associated protein
MHNDEIKNIIQELLEKINTEVLELSLTEEKPGSVWISVELKEPQPFIGREKEGLQALNHLLHRILESKIEDPDKERGGKTVVLDINGVQKKHVSNIRAIAHMMSERARYFKSNIEVDPMTAFERRIVHEFLSDAQDLETESIGSGRTRRVVIKYKGELK